MIRFFAILEDAPVGFFLIADHDGQAARMRTRYVPARNKAS